MIGARIGRRKANAQKIKHGCRKIVANHVVEVCSFLTDFSYLHILFFCISFFPKEIVIQRYLQLTCLIGSD